ncbi:Planctomycete cytochrome C [Neorhodopirellula lusitana]|uniref:Planctomycete cytochrome C n=2 Tax=Neorhodopirellula lusitana TaxID=445327 RepID=A0ABY1Q8S5_9BACT|nr:Planctomycete cytochrome C [Neorhodopirellula lusitana]
MSGGRLSLDKIYEVNFRTVASKMSSWKPVLLAVGVTLVLTSMVSAKTYIPGQRPSKEFGTAAKTFLADYCVDCHGESDPEGNLTLEGLGPVDEINAATWTSVWAQVALKQMPPEDMTQPEVIERLQFSDWIVSELTREMKDKGGFHAHMDPNKGNFLDHDLLFGKLPEGIVLRPTSSPARIWRVTPQEHITRLNELINTEPEYDPEKPGLRTHGDVVPTNHGGELKLYFGTDRIIKWQGGTVAYATSVKSVPAVLSSGRIHGLENYPDFYTVNSAEATQIMGIAGDIIRYMAEGPLSIANAYQITDDPKSIADKMEGDLRGLPTSLIYSTKVVRPLTPVHDLMKQDEVTDQHLRAAVDYLFEALTFRPPSETESDTYLTIVKQSVEKLGKKDGAVLGLSSIFLDRDALFRPELAEVGTPDDDGRVMLQDWELGMAVNHALCYIRPDETLRNAVIEGRMRTRADVKREVERMLADDSIRKPRILRFFRDYFDYDLGGYICKDSKALGATGADSRGTKHYDAMFHATASTDRLIELILQEDKDVLLQLLTTNKVVAGKADDEYFGKARSREEIAASKAAEKKVKAEAARKKAAKLKAWKEANPGKEPTPEKVVRPPFVNHGVTKARLTGPTVYARVSRRSFGRGSMKPERVLATAPEGERLGILTHPSWLVSHSDAMDNHVIRRGRWVQERLLGGAVPDVPITVDAMLPDEPRSTLRERMRVTREEYCWTCHVKMDPLGFPFEMFNHAGLYRETEQRKPVDTSGEIINSGDPALDGKVANAIEMIQKLAESERVEQVFVRHAFRFWMGRNETLNDAPVLQEAHRAYKESGGSMKALLVSLLTSDAFLYRTRAAGA